MMDINLKPAVLLATLMGVASFLIFSCLPSTSPGEDYFLAPDSAGYKVPDGATVVDSIPENLEDGDTLHLSGEYTRKITLFDKHGTKKNPIRIEAQDATIINYGMALVDSSYIIVEGLSAHGGEEGHGFTVLRESDTPVEGIVLRRIASEGYYIGLSVCAQGYPPITDLVVEDSIFAGATGSNMSIAEGCSIKIDRVTTV